MHLVTPLELKTIRKAHSLTQSELAKLLGVTTLTVGNWERGRFAIPADMAKRLTSVNLGAPAAQKADAAAVAKQAEIDKNTFRQYAAMRRWRCAKSDVDPHINPYTGEAFPSSPDGYWPHKRIVAAMRDWGFDFTPEAQRMIVEAFPDIINNGATQ